MVNQIFDGIGATCPKRLAVGVHQVVRSLEGFQRQTGGQVRLGLNGPIDMFTSCGAFLQRDKTEQMQGIKRRPFQSARILSQTTA